MKQVVIFYLNWKNKWFLSILLGLLVTSSAQLSFSQMRSSNGRYFDASEDIGHEEVLKKYGYEYKDLLLTRSAGTFVRIDYSLKDITVALSKSTINSCVIFYFPINKGTENNRVVGMWLIDAEGIRSTHHFDLDSLPPMNQLQNSIVRGPSVVKNNSKSSWDIKSISRQLLPFSELHEYQHVIIVPCYHLGTIPFAMLKPFDNDKTLIEQMSYSIAPSLFEIVIQAEQKLNKLPPIKPLIVGPPKENGCTNYHFSPLQYAEMEASNMAQKFRSAKILIGSKARKDTILTMMKQCDLLYFATHGLANNRNPLDSSFILVNGFNCEQSQITAREIMNLGETKANLAILSACETGLGQAHAAGVIGLSRSFHLIGVRNVVMSLWNVNDKATSELMGIFLEELPKNSWKPAIAMQKSMIRYRKIAPNPTLWAAFSVFGIGI
jgi:hypothetical protein